MRRAFTVGLVALACFAGAAHAQDVVDQQCTPEIWGAFSIALGTPIGQEFVPSHSALTFVELWIRNEPASNNDTARVFVVIHADSLGGPELGASGDVFIPKPYEGAVRFEFPGGLALEPGRTYVIEARRSQGPGNPLLCDGAEFDICPGTRGYFQGRDFSSGRDFWYRTGFDPTPSVRASWGELKLRYR